MRAARVVVGAAIVVAVSWSLLVAALAQEPPTALDAVERVLAETGQPAGPYQVRVSAEDENWAVVAVWTETPPIEPFYALAKRSGAGWQAVLPGAARTYNTWLASLPLSLMDPSTREFLRQPETARLQTHTGFCLPWPVGERATVTTPPSAQGHANQIDYNVWLGGLRYADGRLAATKAGAVKYFKDSSSTQCSWSTSLGKYVYPGTETTCPWTEANLLVLEHPGGEFSWYLHLKQGSVTSRLRAVGQPVHRGDVIATEGTTGWSSGVHLHFMVTTAYAVGASGMPWSNTQVPVDFTNGETTLPYTAMAKDAEFDRLPVWDTYIFLPGVSDDR